MSAALADILNAIEDVAARYVPDLGILEVTYNGVVYFADFNNANHLAVNTGISSGRPICFYDRNPQDEYDFNAIVFADNGPHNIAILRPHGEFVTLDGRTYEACGGNQQVLAIFRNNTVINTSNAKCAHQLSVGDDITEFDIYDYYYNENYNLIQPEPSPFSGPFVSVNPRAFTVVGEYTLSSYGAIKKRLTRIYDELMTLSDGNTKYMITDGPGGVRLYDGNTFNKLKHLSRTIPRKLQLSGADFENPSFDGLDETDAVFNLGNNNFVIYADGEYWAVYRKGEAAAAAADLLTH